MFSSVKREDALLIGHNLVHARILEVLCHVAHDPTALLIRSFPAGFYDRLLSISCLIQNPRLRLICLSVRVENLIFSNGRHGSSSIWLDFRADE
jgi:hypothetical protein